MKLFRAFIAANIEEGARDITALGSPVVLLVVVLLVARDEWLVALGGLITLEIAGRLIKLSFFKQRPRPAAYASLLEKSDAGSFPSIHAARSAFVFLTLLPATDSAVLKVIFLVLPVLVGATRLVLGKHRWGDVAAGLAIGAALAVALPHLLRVGR